MAFYTGTWIAFNRNVDETSTSIIMYYSLLLVICVILLDVEGFARQRRQPHPAGVCGPTQKERWSYEGENGPPNWPQLFPVSCAGRSQSPIDIRTAAVTVNRTLGKLLFTNYNQGTTRALIDNNGHSAEVQIVDGVARTIAGGGLPGVFTFVQLHFHWGSNNARGSEHTINGRRYPLEMHLVHRNNVNQIAVLGVLFQEQPLINPNLEPIFSTLSDIKYEDDSISLTSPLRLDALLPVDKSFYRYQGSLTTPDCNEGVTWTVFRNTVRIGSLQLHRLRQLKMTGRTETQHCQLVDNFRPVQALNNRPVTSNA